MEMAKLGVQFESKKIFYENQQQNLMRNSLGKDRKSIEMIKEMGTGSDKHKKRLSHEDTGLSGGIRLVD